jgi:hypothetical protein
MQIFKGGLRLIKNGKIKFYNQYYSPVPINNYPYTGQLDNQKWYFVGYPPNYHILAMWGDEYQYKLSNFGEFDKNYRAKNCINGYIYWYFWEKN